MTKGFSVDVADFKSGSAHLNGTTDATWIKMIVSTSGAIRVLGYLKTHRTATSLRLKKGGAGA